MQEEAGWLDSREAARYLGLTGKFSFRYLHELSREGKILSGYAGNKLIFKKESLDEFVIKQREVKHAAIKARK